MAHLMKRRRLINPRRRRRMTAKQIRFFGTKRQRAALKARNAGPYSRRKSKKFVKRFGPYSAYTLREAQRISHPRRRSKATRRRRSNVGEILTVMPANPGRRRRSSMYRTHNRRRNRRRRHMAAAEYNRRYNRGRRRHNRRRHNPSVVYRHHNRRRHLMYNRRRRNVGGRFLTGTTGAVVGILGGAAVTKILVGVLPTTFTSGMMGYLATGVGAVVAGQLAGRMTGNRQFGNWVMIGGFLIVALELVNQFFPTLQLPFGLTSGGTAGLGLISSSNFYVPQVNMPGSMASFVTPAGVTAAIPMVPTTATGMHGLGAQFTPGLRTMRRIGRMR